MMKNEPNVINSPDKRLYLPSGYINYPWMLSCGCPFIVIISPRGTGKTYSILDYYREQNESIIFLRRTKTQMELCSTKTGNPYNRIALDKHFEVSPKSSKDFTIINRVHYLEDGEDKAGNTKYLEYVDKELCFLSSLATFYNLRGFDGSQYNTLFFDEIIPEPLERVRRGEGKAFLNMIETIGRNRELEGKKPLQVVLAGNSDTLNSEILRSIGAVEVIENMYAKNQEVYISKERGLAVFYLINSPISQRKAETALYKLANNKEFTDMALHNDFKDLREARDIVNFPLKEFVPLVNINNEFCLYYHKDSNFFYISDHISGRPEGFNFVVNSDKMTFKKKYYDVLVHKMIRKELYFQSFDIKSEFLDLFYAI